jgi:hypothetical protein
MIQGASIDAPFLFNGTNTNKYSTARSPGRTHTSLSAILSPAEKISLLPSYASVFSY